MRPGWFAPVLRANARQARTIRQLSRLVERQAAEIRLLRGGVDPRTEWSDGRRDVRVLEKVAAELRADNAALQRQCDLLMEWCPTDLRDLDIDEEAG